MSPPFVTRMALFLRSVSITGALALVLPMTVCVLLPQAWAQNPQMASTEQKLNEIRQQLRQTGGERQATEASLSEVQQYLRQADAQLAKASREVGEIAAALRELEKRIAEATRERSALQASIAAQRKQLGRLLRQAQIQGNQSALRLLLSQQDIQQTQRMLAYNRYLQSQQMEAMRQVAADLDAVAQLEAQIADDKAALTVKQEAARQRNAELARERQAHAQRLGALNAVHSAQKQKQQALEKDARALESLLSNLRAQSARAEAQRRQAEQRQAQLRQQKEKEKAASPSSSAGRGTTPRTASTSPSVRPSPAQRVGGGTWPVSGQLVTRYGARMSDGRSSTGLLIQAAAGTSVHAVADGRVVFADWMTGYGNILIIDHGSGYLSLYAHNEALLRNQGQSVRRGEAIARVGNSGGQGRNALYFELRRNGQPIDPATWLKR